MAFRYQARTAEDWERRASQQGTNFQGYVSDEFRMYVVKKGENSVRVLPPTWDNAKHYGMDIYVHFSVGPDKASVLCPQRMAEQPCPVCEARALAEKRGEEELVKELRPAKRVLVWVIDRKDEDKGPLVWGMPWTLDRDISKVSRDRSTGKFYSVDHPEEGFDVYFDRDGDGIGTKYTGVQLARRATSVDAEWLDFVEAHPLPDTLLVRDYDEIKQLFDGGTAPEEDAPVRPLARGNGSERPSRERSERPAPAERDATPARSARPQLNRARPAEPPAETDEPPFEGGTQAAADPPSDEPPDEPQEDAPPRQPRPTTPAREREPAPAATAAAATASKAASLRDRFARKTT